MVTVGATAQTLTVTNANLQGWGLVASSGTGNNPPPAVYLAPGFETPPLGIGSVHLSPGQDGGDAAQARHAAYAGTPISSLTALSYSTFTEVDGSGGQSPYIILNIDLDGNLGTTDSDLWFFEPGYQSAAFFPSNPQGPLVTDAWQTWNALAGGWWSSAGTAGAGPGANVKSIAQLLAAAPNAVIDDPAAGGVRIVTGFGAGAWDNFLGAADNFRIATVGFDTTYDFETDPLTTITITPAVNLENWTLTTTDDGDATGSPSSTVVTGPGTPPIGTGSLQLAVGPDGGDSAEARSNRFDGLYLRDMTELDYQARHVSGGSGGQMAYVILRVDYDNNGTQDDLLFFEPVYQTGAFCPSNPQPAVATGVWQTWEAANGCWWSLNNTAGAGPGVNVKSLAQILDVEADARIATSSAEGGVRIVAGFGAGAWDNFIGNVDAFNTSFGTLPTPTRALYDFDPLPLINIADLALNEGNVGNTPFNFLVTLDKPVSYTVTVQYATANNTATTADLDYTAVPLTTITFLANDTSENALVNVTGDTKLEGNETFFVNLSNVTNATISDNQATGTISNDDPVPTISISDVTMIEGNGPGVFYVFNVTLSNPSASTVTMNYATADGTALTAIDFGGGIAGTLTFAPGATLQTINVPVGADTTREPDEYFFVNLTNPVNATFGDNQGVGTILNDDPVPVLSIGNVTQAEGTGGIANFVFPINFTNGTDQPITFDYATANGTAIAGSDYTTNTGTISVPPGISFGVNITVVVNADTLPEANETFFVNISNPTNATISDNQGLGTILNDDVNPTVGIGNVTVSEGNAGTTAFVFDVALSGPSGQTITVDFATANGTAFAGTDYATASGTVTFAPFDTIETVTVNVLGDVLPEADDTFFVNLTNPTNATISDNQGAGTILNDDAGPTISISDVTLSEGNAGTTAFTFNVTLSGPSGLPITVDFATANGTATAGADYTAASGTVTFVPTDTSETVTVNVLGETVTEVNETFFINLTNASNAPIADNQGLGTIVNDDPAPTITISDVTLSEGNAGATAFTFPVTLSGPSALPITVDFATAPGTATAGGDYTTTSGTVTFNPLATTQSVTVDVIGETAFEPAETFFVNLTNPANATIADNQGLGTILNDDPPVADISISKTGPVVAFYGTPVNYTITVSNAGPQDASSVVVTDTIPAATTFVSVTPSQGSCTGTTTITCTLGAIAAGGNATISLVVTAPTTSGPFSNTATAVNTPEVDPTPGNNAGGAVVIAQDTADVPTLSEWMLVALAMALAAFAAMKLRG